MIFLLDRYIYTYLKTKEKKIEMIDTKRLVLHTLKQIYDSILAIQDLNRGQID